MGQALRHGALIGMLWLVATLAACGETAGAAAAGDGAADTAADIAAPETGGADLSPGDAGTDAAPGDGAADAPWTPDAARPDAGPRDGTGPELPLADAAADGPGDTPAGPELSDAGHPDAAPDATLGDQALADGPGDLGPADTPPVPDSSDTEEPPATLTFTIVVTDLWVQALPAGALAVHLAAADGAEVPLVAEPPRRFQAVVTRPGRYLLEASAPDHESAAVALDVTFDGPTPTLAAAELPEPRSAGPGLAVAHGATPSGPTHTVYLGLRHRYFAPSGPPPRAGNRLTLLMDGEEAWTLVRERILAARERIHISTWWWDSTFELLRPFPAHLTQTAEQRRENTIFASLWLTPALVRTLVNQFGSQDGFFDWLTTDDDLDAAANDPDDGFEFMGMANPTTGRFWFEIPPFSYGERVRAALRGAGGQAFDPDAPIPSPVDPREVDLTDFPFGFEAEISSYHQKFMVLDGREAFVGGMNLRGTDWDTSEHLVFEPRRMDFATPPEDRLDVYHEQADPDTGPRKDYMLHLVGPSVEDVDEVFQARWHQQIADGVAFSENSTPFEVATELPAEPAGVTVQVTVTLPEPFHRASIIESWLSAIRTAEHYIFIEDQYWRMPILNDAIAARMHERPELLLLVVTKPVSEWTDPGCRWTHETHAFFRAAFPTRYATYQLRAFDDRVACSFCWDETDGEFRDIDVHSKLLIVDDRFLSLGSCNKNNRGLLYEGEMNLAVLDDAFVSAARARIVANMLGPGGDLVADAPFAEVFDAFAAAAAENDAVYARWEEESFDLDLDGDPLPWGFTPSGFVYSLAFGAVEDCLVEDIGPDIAK